MSLLLTLTMLHGLFSICLMMLTKRSTLEMDFQRCDELTRPHCQEKSET